MKRLAKKWTLGETTRIKIRGAAFAAAITTSLCTAQASLAFQYLTVHLFQTEGAYLFDTFTGLAADERAGVDLASSNLAGGAATRAKAQVPGAGGRVVSGSGYSKTGYQLSPGGAGSASIDQVVFNHGYSAGLYYGNARAGAGTNSKDWGGGHVQNVRGDTIAIDFRVDESDGDLVFKSFSSTNNSLPVDSNTDMPDTRFLVDGGVGGTFVVSEDRQHLPAAGDHLTPGYWTLFIIKPGIAVPDVLAYQSSHALSGFAASWTFDDVFVGQTPIVYAHESTGCPHINCGIDGQDVPSTDPTIEPPPASEPDFIAGVKLTSPIVGTLGKTDKFFVGLSSAVDEGPIQGALVTGYKMNSEFLPTRGRQRTN